jgi:hypothetical protein
MRDRLEHGVSNLKFLDVTARLTRSGEGRADQVGGSTHLANASKLQKALCHSRGVRRRS